MPHTTHTSRRLSFALLLFAALAPGCMSVMELQDGRVLRPGEEEHIFAVGAQLQREARAAPAGVHDEDEHWPISPVLPELTYRYGKGLRPGLQVNAQLSTVPIVVEGLVSLGGGVGLKIQLLGDETSPFALSMSGGVQGSTILVSSSDVGALGHFSTHLSMPMSVHFRDFALYGAPKIIGEFFAVSDFGAGQAWSAGGSLGLRFGQRGQRNYFFEATSLYTPVPLHRDGALLALGFGWSFE